MPYTNKGFLTQGEVGEFEVNCVEDERVHICQSCITGRLMLHPVCISYYRSTRCPFYIFGLFNISVDDFSIEYL